MLLWTDEALCADAEALVCMTGKPGQDGGRQNSRCYLVALTWVLQLESLAQPGGAAPIARLQPAASCITCGQ